MKASLSRKLCKTNLNRSCLFRINKKILIIILKFYESVGGGEELVYAINVLDLVKD